MELAWLLLLLPLCAATATLVRLYRQPDMALFAAIGSSALCLIVSLNLLSDPTLLPTLPWLEVAGWKLDFALLLDPLSKVFLVTLNFILFFIHLYAVGALASDARRASIFGLISFFSLAVTGLVLSANLFMLLFFSELAAWAVFLLLRLGPEEAEAAGESLFPSLRFWNISLVIALLALALLSGTTSFLPESINTWAQLPVLGHGVLLPAELPPDFKGHLISAKPSTLTTTIPLLGLLGIGLFGSQLVRLALPPYSTWLARGASGSIPGLALLGLFSLSSVFLLVRLYPLLVFSYFTLDLLAVLGAVSALLASWQALWESDLKKLLAWLYVVQLGLMVMTIGCGLPSAALTQTVLGGSALTLLILAAGSFQQNRPTSPAELSGRGWTQPWTGAAFALGSLSLAGFPPLAGYFSNAGLLAAAGRSHWSFYLVTLLALSVTIFSSGRVLVLLFGNRVPPPGRESAPILTVPLVFLSLPVLFGGIPFGSASLPLFLHNALITVLQSSGEWPRDGRLVPLPTLPFFFSSFLPLLALIGAGLGALSWPRVGSLLGKQSHPVSMKRAPAISFPLQVARTLAWMENWLVEGLFWRGLAWCGVILGELFRLLQTGDLRSYTWLFVMGGLALIYYTLFFF